MRKHVMTARRKAALRKAQLASARKRRQNRTNSWKNMKARRKAMTPAQKRKVRKDLRNHVGKPLAKGLAFEIAKSGVLRQIKKTNPGLAVGLRLGTSVAELAYYSRKAYKQSSKKSRKGKKR